MSEPITIVYPHYLSTDWLLRSVKSHRMLSDEPISVWAVDMSSTEKGFSDFKARVAGLVDHVVWLKVNRRRYYCGEALELVLPLIGTIVPSGITILSDTDTLILRKGWDTELRAQLTDHEIASINPRSPYEPYVNVPEWNWMAFRSGTVWSFCDNDGLNDIDWGQYVKRRFNYRTKLWPWQSVPIPRCQYAAVCGDEKGPWAIHAFFATSKLSGDKRDHSLAMTDQEIDHLCLTLAPQVFQNEHEPDKRTD